MGGRITTHDMDKAMVEAGILPYPPYLGSGGNVAVSSPHIRRPNLPDWVASIPLCPHWTEEEYNRCNLAKAHGTPVVPSVIGSWGVGDAGRSHNDSPASHKTVA